MPDAQKIIEIKNVKVQIGKTKIFDNLSIEIENGCNTAILGPNGAGKTTFLRLLTKELSPIYDENSYIRIWGKERWNVWDLRSHIGIISHNLQQFIYESAPGKDVILTGYYGSSDIWEHQRFSNEQIERAESVMEFLGIIDLREREFAQMSTGQQRKFLLGRALINQPDVLVLDEPTSGLDIKACFQYIEIIRNLMKEGKTIILVTHHIHEIPPEIKRVILLKKGEIIADGNKENILNDKVISGLYEVPVKLVHAGGFYQTLPVGD